MKVLSLVFILVLCVNCYSQQLFFGINNKGVGDNVMGQTFLGGNIGHRWDQLSVLGYYSNGRKGKFGKYDSFGVGARWYFRKERPIFNCYVDGAFHIPFRKEVKVQENSPYHVFIKFNTESYVAGGINLEYKAVEVFLQSGLSLRNYTFHDYVNDKEFNQNYGGFMLLFGANIYINYKKKA